MQRTGDLLQDYLEQGGSLVELMDKVRQALEKSGIMKFGEAEEEEGNAEAGA